MNRKKQPPKSVFNQTWIKITGVITSISALIGLGYVVGTFKGEIDCKTERIELIEVYQEKLSEQKESCNEGKIEKVESQISEINTFIDNLKRDRK
jgi:hypothetical protein